MKRKRYSGEQIVYALRQVESGSAAVEICRKLGVSEQTFYRWKKKYSGVGAGQSLEAMGILASLLEPKGEAVC